MSGIHFIQNSLLSLLSYILSILSKKSLSFLVRTSSKIVRISSILEQEPRKRYKEDKERRKVKIGRLRREEEGFEVLLSKKNFSVKILERNHSKELVS